MPVFGLIGKSLGHSFSKAWFTAKFEREGLTSHQYINLELPSIDLVIESIRAHQLSGFNVTIPYKEAILPYLDELSVEAKEIGAVNTVKVLGDGKLRGYNTDCHGFMNTLKPLLKPYHTAALILGTGGASKAIAYSLKKLGIDYHFISRQKSEGVYKTYAELTLLDVRNAPIIINTTPVGMSPDAALAPEIPYQGIDKFHLLYDLVYNPAETTFLRMGTHYGAATINGYAMLIKQAEYAWKIWNE
jgi:shikimate dehydrogenase